MIIFEGYMHIRQKEILAEAERNRLINQIKSSPGLPNPTYARTMTWIGNRLLTWGTWLTAKFGEKTIIAPSAAMDNTLVD